MLGRPADAWTRGGACSRKPKPWCLARLSWLPASGAPLQNQFVDLGVRQVLFAVLGRDPAKLLVPKSLLNAIERASQSDKLFSTQGSAAFMISATVDIPSPSQQARDCDHAQGHAPIAIYEEVGFARSLLA